jgi:bifunctional non-homologous end joining protein LigD
MSREHKTSRAGERAGEPLSRYRAMRDFAATPEPHGRGARRKKTEALHYYIQRHNARRLHYDFRLELDGVLKSWAVPKGPSLDPAERRLAVQVEDHPVDYGDFEGVIPAGQYGAGEVLLWDQGNWTPEEVDPAKALAAGKLKFRLEGHKLHGLWTLVRMHGRAAEEEATQKRPNWLLIKDHDAAEREGAAAEITERAPESVKARQEVAESPAAEETEDDAPRAELPAFVTPQLATLVAEAPPGEGWLYEIKYDGYRLLARLSGREVRLFTRNGKDWTARLPHLAKALAGLKLKDAWLDGEIVVLGEDGLPSFQALQNAFDAGRDAGVMYYLFDAPWLNGRDLTRRPLAERKRRLFAAVAPRAGGPIGLSEHFAGSGREALAEACRMGLEGLIGKRADGAYLGGRGNAWIKLKCRPRQEFVIGGYTEPKGGRQGFGALLLGLHEPGAETKLRYVGRAGTGFNEATLTRLSRRLAELKRDASPFIAAPRAAGVHWVRPVLTAEIEFAGWTDEQILRQAAFVGLREDKPAKEVRAEVVAEPPAGKKAASTTVPRRGASAAKSGEATVAGIAISHPERPIWPEQKLSKLDLARYCEAVADWFLPHLVDRPLALLRCPDGSAAECFFQKHMGQDRPAGVKSFEWSRSSAKDQTYLYLENLQGLIGLVQRGVVEFHTWGASLPRADRPDRITLDLDPDAGLPWARVVEAAQLTRALLEELGLTAFLKTTGGKGLHLVVPLQRRHGWEEVKSFAQAAASHLARLAPDRFTANMAKSKRTGRIFIDYLRNGEGATAVAAYSPRARPGAPVSTPIAWEELTLDLRPADFNLETLPARLAGLHADPWADYGKVRYSLTKGMRQALGLA